MTLREKIADWISKGALTELMAENAALAQIVTDLEADLSAAEFNAEKHRATLDLIASMETPRCASIGKRMARVARGE